MLMTRPREEWLHDVAARYRALEQFTQEDSRLQFLRILRSLPYGELATRIGPGLAANRQGSAYTNASPSAFASSALTLTFSVDLARNGPAKAPFRTLLKLHGR